MRADITDLSSHLRLTTQRSRIAFDMQIAHREMTSGRATSIAKKGPAAASRIEAIRVERSRLIADADTLTTLKGRFHRMDLGLEGVEQQIVHLRDALASAQRHPQALSAAYATISAILADMGDVLIENARTAGAPRPEATSGEQLAQVISDIVSAPDPSAALDAYLDPGGSFDADFGGAPVVAEFSLASGRDAPTLSSNFADAVRETVRSLAELAIGEGKQSGADAVTLATRAADSATWSRTLTGAASKHAEDLEVSNAARLAALDSERNGLDLVDPYEAATRVRALQDQMDAVLLVTRRMSDLSLVRYMR
ncbi:hypothetical protein [Roseobacter sp. HKCCA0434]|uniref:hypothetical protein n=1 Tax=Roseobacter sp. HKCCA0434 TaxID=3079297 RepID=UPI002905C019|nr:hypothetical protein [Roseobacter sp. HKCCA0434]